MAFSFTIIRQTVQGDRKVVYGTFTNSTSSGGDITTGLRVVENFSMQMIDTAVVTDVPVANETFPLGGATAVTIVTVADKNGLWRAEGY